MAKMGGRIISSSITPGGYSNNINSMNNMNMLGKRAPPPKIYRQDMSNMKMGGYPNMQM
jgi:hypothetical protein